MTNLNLPPELADLRVGDLDADQVLALLDATAEGGIRLAFSGKQAARQIARRVRPRTLSTVKRNGAGPPEEAGRNLLIEGDNLQAMVTLYRYRGQVDLILTDPPYNTGRDFRYNDRWDDDPNDEGLGDLVHVEDTARHTKWLKFMWPRLQMMKAMLKPSGVLAICIDNRELFRLGQMLDELFGESNRLAIINWEKSYSPRGDRAHVSTATEYVLVYAKDETKARTRLLPRTEEMDARYSSPDGDPRFWKSSDLAAAKGRENQGMVYAIQSPFTGELHYPPPSSCWRPAQRAVLATMGEWDVKYKLKTLDDTDFRAELLSLPVDEVKPAKAVVLDEPLKTAKAKALRRMKQGVWPRIYFGLDGEGRPAHKRYLDEVKRGKVPTTYWADDDYDTPLSLGATSWSHAESGHSQTGVKELDAIVGDRHGFQTVKPLQLFEKIIQIWCKPDGLVLDPFAGSGTTGHAVLGLNSATEAQRQFILIEQGRPENGDAYARTLTADRLRRVVTGDWKTGHRAPLGSGFTYKRLSGKIDGAAVLNMARADMRDTVIFAHFSEQRRRDALVPVDVADYDYLVAVNGDNEGFFLVWDGPDRNTDLTRSVYSAIVEEAKKASLTLGRYHVYARRWVYQRKTTSFYQIPDHILASFGLDVRSEPFGSEDLD